MKKFAIVGATFINNSKLEEFILENKDFTIKSNSFGEIFLNDTFMGIMNSRTKTDKGWRITISYLCISGAVVTDEIEIEVIKA